MKKLVKNTALSILAGSCALCLGGAVALQALPRKANAAEVTNTYTAFVDVGANATAQAADAVIGLTDKGFTATTPGTSHEGDSLFESYAEDATYTATVEAGTYTVAVAVLVEAAEGAITTEVKINDTAVEIPEGTLGKYVASEQVTVSDTSVKVEVTGKLCGALVAGAESKTAFVAELPEDGQVISYGKKLEDELDKVVVYRADGSVEESMEYGNINASTGVNLNFTTVNNVAATASVDIDGDAATADDVLQFTFNRHITTMPDDLVYFINCGSFDEIDSHYDDPETQDGYYSYNQTIFDYYGKYNEETQTGLINHGTPDQASSSDDQWGIYTKFAHNAPGDSTFPYNSFNWTTASSPLSTDHMGYRLTGLKANENYRIWFGTLSHWHARTSNLTFNGNAAETLRIGAEKAYSIYENVPADGNGRIDIHLTQIGSQNEPTLCFIAVQKMSTPLTAEAPASVEGNDSVGLYETSMTFSNVVAGAQLRLYNAAKPNQLLYEETVDGEKLSDGNYLVDWQVNLFEQGIRKFQVVQVNDRGVSQKPLEVTITDIENFSLTVGDYSTDRVQVTVHAEANSGITQWSYRLGEFGVPTTNVLTERVKNFEESFSVTENGDWYVLVYSGNNVSFEGVATVNKVDTSAPEIVFVPSLKNWKQGSYEVDLTVNSVSPVVEYALYKDGVEETRTTSAPASLTFEGVGVYTVFVRTSAGQSATSSLRISDVPKTTQVVRTVTSSGARYQFNDVVDGKDTVYKVKEITVYRLGDEVERISVLSGNVIELSRRNGAGTYVANVVTESGEVEMFSFEVTAEALRGGKVGGLSGSAAIGVGVGIGVGGLVIAAAAVVVTVLLKKKKHQ